MVGRGSRRRSLATLLACAGPARRASAAGGVIQVLR